MQLWTNSQLSWKGVYTSQLVNAIGDPDKLAVAVWSKNLLTIIVMTSLKLHYTA